MKKHQYVIFFLLVICLLGGMLWIHYLPSGAKEQLRIEFIERQDFLLNEEIEPLSLVASSNSAHILYPTIDTGTPGEKHLLYIAVSESGVQKEFLKTIIVKSPTPPQLILKDTKVTIIQGEHFDPKDMIISASDAFDGELTPDIIGEFDCDKEGEYNIVYRVSNSSHLTSEVRLLLIVEKKEVKKEEANPPTIPTQPSNQRPNDTPQTPVEKPSAPIYQGKRKWLVSEGYDFKSAQSACMEAGKQTNQTYTCEVLWDEYGLAIGYQLLY